MSDIAADDDPALEHRHVLDYADDVIDRTGHYLAGYVVVRRDDFDNLVAYLDRHDDYFDNYVAVAARRLVDNQRRATERHTTRSDDSAGR